MTYLNQSLISLPAADWLVEGSTISKVLIRDDVVTRISKSQEINLDVQFSDGTNLQDKCNEAWLRLVIRYIFAVRDTDLHVITTAKHHKCFVYHLITFLEWLRLNGFYSLKDVTNDVIDRYVEQISNGKPFALRHLERIEEYFSKTNIEDIPTLRDRSNNKTVARAKILRSIGINWYLQATDKVSTAFLDNILKNVDFQTSRKIARSNLPKPEYKRISRLTLKRYMHPVRHLYIFRNELGDESLNFLPFGDIFDKSRGVKTTDTKHTHNITPEETVKLLNTALKWVFYYAPTILQIYKDVQIFYGKSFDEINRSDRKRIAKFVKEHPLNKAVKNDEDSPFPISHYLLNRVKDGDTISLYSAVRHLIPAAAIIVIGVFSARRNIEITSLDANCIRKDEERYWLRTFIAKTHRKEREISSVKLVADAVALIHRWKKLGGKNNKTLFSFWHPGRKEIKTIDILQDLQYFAEVALNFKLSEPIQVRQFRRFFAITYFWRFKLGSLPALTHFLCHNSVAMTKEYITDKECNKEFAMVHEEFSKDFLVKAATGEREISGPFAKVWQRRVQQIRKHISKYVQFKSPQEQEKAFLQQVSESVRPLMPTPGGACASREIPRDVHRARCSQIDPVTGVLTKMPEFATPSKCGSCAFAITDNDHALYWKEALEQAKVAATKATGLSKQLALQEVKIVGKFVNNYLPEGKQ